jgi:gamma-glutamyltranspeptidase / glutathione hydrolase
MLTIRSSRKAVRSRGGGGRAPRSVRGVLVCILLLVADTAQGVEPSTKPDGNESGDIVRCRNGAVVSVNSQASDVGLDILKRGGNAVDAAVATAFALAVTHPAAGNIGGGGYMLVVPGGGNARPVAFDFRETAPAAATRNMFVEASARTAHRRVGVPGTVRGLALAHDRFGRLSWRDVVSPAVGLARDGFQLDRAAASSLNKVLDRSNKTQFSELHRVYGRPSGGAWREGDRLVSAEMSATLRRIADAGPDAFYLGETADQIVAEMRRGNGLITKQDLASYQAKAREPIRGTYRGFEIVGAPPSSSGGVTLVETLNILETFDLRSRGRWSPETLHLIVEAMKRSYRDRACYLGDPETTTIPEKLTTKQYANQLAEGIDPRRATPSTQLADGIRIVGESDHTTHLSAVDHDRTAVSLTYTLESSYGSRVVVPGGGFILNDEMNDFGWLPEETDLRGRIGTSPNQIAPGKRMLSSMCPTVVLRDQKPYLITGSPGGRTIINTVLCVVVNVVDFKMDIRTAIDAPRMHHQWLPDQVRMEAGLFEAYPEPIRKLQELGHAVDKSPRQGDAHSILIDPDSGVIMGAADRRTSGKAAGY